MVVTDQSKGANSDHDIDVETQWMMDGGWWRREHEMEKNINGQIIKNRRVGHSGLFSSFLLLDFDIMYLHI